MSRGGRWGGGRDWLHTDEVPCRPVLLQATLWWSWHVVQESASTTPQDTHTSENMYMYVLWGLLGTKLSLHVSLKSLLLFFAPAHTFWTQFCFYLYGYDLWMQFSWQNSFSINSWIFLYRTVVHHIWHVVYRIEIISIPIYYMTKLYVTKLQCV